MSDVCATEEVGAYIIYLLYPLFYHEPCLSHKIAEAKKPFFRISAPFTSPHKKAFRQK